jgi:hypothetical protein
LDLVIRLVIGEIELRHRPIALPRDLLMLGQLRLSSNAAGGGIVGSVGVFSTLLFGGRTGG